MHKARKSYLLLENHFIQEKNESRVFLHGSFSSRIKAEKHLNITVDKETSLLRFKYDTEPLIKKVNEKTDVLVKKETASFFIITLEQDAPLPINILLA